MVYTYDDRFVVDSIDIAELERYEAQSVEEVGRLGITDSHYIDRLVVIRTYMLACRSQLEADGMQDKYRVYEKEYDRAMKEAILSAKNQDGIKSDMPVWSVKVGRS